MSHGKREAHIFMGTDGVGKSTVSKQIAEMIGGTQIDTGELLRQYNKPQGDPNLEKAFKTRALASEDLVRQLVTEAIEAAPGDICFCGIPRTKEQADWLIEMADRHSFRISAWYFLLAGPDTCMTRTQNRPDRVDVARDDQQRSIINYFEMMEEVYQHVIRRHFTAITVDAEPALEVVLGSIESLPTIQPRIAAMT